MRSHTKHRIQPSLSRVSLLVVVSIITILLLGWYVYYLNRHTSRGAEDSVRIRITRTNTGATLSARSSNPGDLRIRVYAINLTYTGTINSMAYALGKVSAGIGDENVKGDGTIKIVGESHDPQGTIIPLTVDVPVVTLTYSDPNVAITGMGGSFIKINNDNSLSQIPVTFETVGQPTQTVSETPVLSPSPSDSPTPTSGDTGMIELDMKLRFQGIIRKPVAGTTLSTGITLVNLNDGYTSDTKPVTFSVNDQGVWTGSTSVNAKPGVGYYVLVKGPKHVQKKICILNPTESTPGTYRCAAGAITLNKGKNMMDFSRIYQLVGDLPDQDGIVDSYDVSFLRLNLGKNDDKSLSVGDVNLDGLVDTQDYSLVIASLSTKRDEE